MPAGDELRAAVGNEEGALVRSEVLRVVRVNQLQGRHFRAVARVVAAEIVFDAVRGDPAQRYPDGIHILAAFRAEPAVGQNGDLGRAHIGRGRVYARVIEALHVTVDLL